jgi:hypothetical protein
MNDASWLMVEIARLATGERILIWTAQRYKFVEISGHMAPKAYVSN